jgi:hypothetical protein
MARTSQPPEKKSGKSGGRKRSAGGGDEPTRPKATRTEYDITAEEFIKAWQGSTTADEVVAKLGGKMSKGIIHARASKYRAAGVRLKKMPRGRARELDVDRLNRLVAEIDARERGVAPSLDEADRVPIPDVPPPSSAGVDPGVVSRVAAEVMAKMQKNK